MKNSFTALKLGFALISMSLAGCSPTSGSGTSKVSITIPKSSSIQSLRSSGVHSQQAIDWDRGCYAINVTASDLPAGSTGSCSIPTGIFSGFVAAGGTLQLDVPRGSARKLEVLFYKRLNANAKCPTFDANSFNSMDPASVVRVGKVDSFETKSDSVTVDVYLTVPGDAESLISQYKLAAACSKVAETSSGGTGTSLGHVAMAGGNYKMDVTVRASSLGTKLTGGNYVIQLGR